MIVSAAYLRPAPISPTLLWDLGEQMPLDGLFRDLGPSHATRCRPSHLPFAEFSSTIAGESDCPKNLLCLLAPRWERR